MSYKINAAQFKANYAAYLAKKKKMSTTPRYKKNSYQQRYGRIQEVTPEVKVVDTSISTACSSTGAVQLLNGCIQGTSDVQRIGQKIQMTSVDFELVAENPALANNTVVGSDVVQVSIIYDRQSNAAAPAWSDVFTQTTTTSAPMGHRVVANLDRFEVLATEKFTLSASGDNSFYKTRYVKMHHDTRFNGGNAGTVADIQSGSLYLIFSSQGAIANIANNSLIIGTVRMRFRDL